MTVFLWGAIIFSFAFLLQLTIWRIRLPRRQIKTLLQIFFGTLLASFLILNYTSFFFKELGLPVLTTLPEYLQALLLFVSLTLAYMITYSAIEADSPSLVMIRAVAKAGSGGLDKKEFEKTMNDDLLVIPRVRDLVADKMAYMEGDKYILTPKGLFFAKVFILYRSLLNAPKGG